MSVKYFCDLCGNEMKVNLGRLTGEVPEKVSADRKIVYPKMTFEVMTGKGGVANDGNFCHSCIRKAILDSGPATS